MAYTDGQIERLRNRLCAYRAQKGENGRMRPWKALIDDILMSEATAHEYPEDGALPEFKEEALRRFAAGASVPSQDKLEDIQAFLVEQRFLTDCALTDGVWDYTVALSLRSLFGDVAGGSEFCGRFSGNYRAETTAKSGSAGKSSHYDIDVGPVEGESILRLDRERFNLPNSAIEYAEIEKRYGDQIRSEVGYGLPAPGDELVFFFKDGLTDRTEILLVTDIMDRDEGAVDWFQAVKVNSVANFTSQTPEANDGSVKFDKVLYRSLRLIEAEKVKG